MSSLPAEKRPTIVQNSAAPRRQREVLCALSLDSSPPVDNGLFAIIEVKVFYAIRGVQCQHVMTSFLKGGVALQAISPTRPRRYYFFVREKKRMRLSSDFFSIFTLTFCAHSLFSAGCVPPSLIGPLSERVGLDRVLAVIGCRAMGAFPVICATLWRHPPLRAQTSKEAGS